MNFKHLLNGQNTHQKVERHILLGVGVGTLMLIIGIATSIFSSTGVPAILSLVGSFITFIFAVILVFYWVFVGDK